MKLLLPIFITILTLFIYSCANQIAPTGGPKDTIPPNLTHSIPPSKTINYSKQTFKLYFDERINTDKLKQDLIITPFTENKYEVKSKKNELQLIFEDPFDSATTYTLNFGNGVTDIHEKTPAVNLSLAFSTGPIIDSIYIKGNVTSLFENEQLENIIISLYHVSDTLNILTGKPRYFTKTDEDGNYSIENIKNGYYRVYAFDDINNNMMNDPEEEVHGFLADSIDLNTSKENIDLFLLLLDTRPLKFNRGKYTGIYFDVSYNKFVSYYKITQLNTNDRLDVPPNNLISDNTSIRFYYDSLYRYDRDSLGIIITAIDSINNQTIDTTYVQFRQSKRKPASFSYNITPKNKSKLNDIIKNRLVFDKPIQQFFSDSIRFQYDTLIYQFVPDSSLIWNSNKTELSFQTQLYPKQFVRHLDSLKILHSDTSNHDSTEIEIRTYLHKVDTSRIELIIPAQSFISVEYDTTKIIKSSYQFKKNTDFGTVSGNITTDQESYVLQLVTTSYDVVSQIKNPQHFSFKQVPPGKYTFRILVDSNNDGNWEYGNIQQNREPEAVYFYPEEFDVRANWQLDNLDIQF